MLALALYLCDSERVYLAGGTRVLALALYLCVGGGGAGVLALALYLCDSECVYLAGGGLGC